MQSWTLRSSKNGSQWSKKHGRDSSQKNGPPRLPEARRNLPHGAQPGVRSCLDCEQMSAHHVFDVSSPVAGRGGRKKGRRVASPDDYNFWYARALSTV